MTGANSILARMAVIISANNAEFNRAMAQSSKTLQGFQNTIKSATNLLAGGLGLYSVTQAARYTIGTLANFERQMDTVAAITGATGDEFRTLEQNALKLGRSTEYTATQVGQLQTEYGRLGFTTAEILNVTEATINLATATGENLSKSADIAGSTLRGFNLDASQTVHVTDVMASSFNKSALGLENFGEAIKYASSSAFTANVTLEETTAMLAVLADAGLRGSIAGTSLRRIFTLIAKDGRDVTDRLDELSKKGISVADAYDEVGLTAQNALLILSRNNDKVKELTGVFQNANGETQKMADIMRDNLVGDWAKFTSSIEGAVLSGGGFVDVLRDIVQLLTQLTNNVDLSGITRDFMFLANVFGISDAWDRAMERAHFVGPQPASNATPTWGLLPTPKKSQSPNGGGDPTISNSMIRQASLNATKDFDVPAMTHELNEYEAALIRGLAAQDQFRASSIDLSDKAGPAFEATAEHLKKLGNSAIWDNIRSNMDQTAKDTELSSMRMIRAFDRVGDAIGDAMVDSIESGDKFVTSLINQVDQTVQQLYRIAVGYILANAAKMGNPIAALTVATVGVIGMRAAFASIRRGQDARLAEPQMEVNRRRLEASRGGVHVTGEFRMRGSEMRAALDNYDRDSGRTGG